ncbi:MAG: ATP-binding cassette domain-containing protein [Gammaproteobacteria bacterium]
MEPLVKVDNLYRYYGEQCAVRNVSFELHKGEILGFLGPNGAGKTTTMRIIAGNLAASAGSVSINGIDIYEDPKAAKAIIGYLPEQPPLYQEMKVLEFLAYCAILNRIDRGKRAAAVDAAIERCGLAEVRHRLIGNLSKGFQQRVGIAQAIIHTPPIVVLDEPTIGLDPIQIIEIRQLIVELGREHSVILSTHILPEVQSVCTTVQIINKGELVFRGDVATLNEYSRITSAVLGARRLPDQSALLALPGVTGVTRLDDERVRLSLEPDAHDLIAVARTAVDSGWELFALTPESKSLEQVFIELTTADIAGTGEST